MKKLLLTIATLMLAFTMMAQENDLEIISTLGLTANDKEKISKIEGVKWQHGHHARKIRHDLADMDGGGRA